VGGGLNCFVFRERRAISLTVGLDRLLATCVSSALCLVYLLTFPSTPVGLVAIIGIGTVVMMLLDREDDIVTTGITTTVVLVVAALSPNEAWHQPILRLIDTAVGVGVGLSCKWIASFAFFCVVGQPVR
jgi:uncharacterized membrane protein YgaE (UPF0421/DUF939 family)